MKTIIQKNKENFLKIKFGFFLGIALGMYYGYATLYQIFHPVSTFTANFFLIVPYLFIIFWIWKRKRKEKTVLENGMMMLIGFLWGVILIGLYDVIVK